MHSRDCLADLNFAKKVKEGLMGGSFNFVSSGELRCGEGEREREREGGSAIIFVSGRASLHLYVCKSRGD